VRLEDGEILRRIGIALLTVIPGHEGGIEVLGSRVSQLVDHPGGIHSPILVASGVPGGLSALDHPKPGPV
jgi:hypothetical protein